MNIYDPADFITYVSLEQRQAPSSARASATVPGHRLPSGYANQSPRTRLRGDAADRPVGDARGRPHTTERHQAVVLEDALRALRAAPGGEQLPRVATKRENGYDGALLHCGHAAAEAIRRHGPGLTSR